MEIVILSKNLGYYFQKSGKLAAPKKLIQFFLDLSKKNLRVQNFQNYHKKIWIWDILLVGLSPGFKTIFHGLKNHKQALLDNLTNIITNHIHLFWWHLTLEGVQPSTWFRPWNQINHLKFFIIVKMVSYFCLSVSHTTHNISFQRSRICLGPNWDTTCPTLITIKS